MLVWLFRPAFIIPMQPGHFPLPSQRDAALATSMRKHSAVSALAAVKTGNDGEIGAMGISTSAQARLNQVLQGKKPPVGRATATRHPMT